MKQKIWRLCCLVWLGSLGIWGGGGCLPTPPDFACYKCKTQCPEGYVCLKDTSNDDGRCVPKGYTIEVCATWIANDGKK